MKLQYLCIVLTLLLTACREDSTQPPPKSSVSSSDKTNPAAATPSRSDFPSAEEIAVVEGRQYIKAEGGSDFTIKIAGASPGRANLYGFMGESNYLADTTMRSADGTMHFSRPEGYNQGLYLVSMAKDRHLQVMLGPDQKFRMVTSLNNPDGDMQVEGSADNSAFFENITQEKASNAKLQVISEKMTAATEGSAEYLAAQKAQNDLLDQRDADLEKLYKKYPNTLFEKFKRAGANPRVRTDVPKETITYHYRQEFWNDVDFSDRRLLHTPVIHNKLKRFFDVLTPQNQDSIHRSAKMLIDKTLSHAEFFKFISNWVVMKYDPKESNLMDPEFVHVKLVQDYFTKERAFWADSMVIYGIQQQASEMQNSLIWHKAPNVISKDLNGVTHNLLANDEDYLIVYMFTPSCEHCIEETPKLVKWYNDQKAQGKSRDVFGIALESNLNDPDELANYISKNKITFPVIWDASNRSIYKTYYSNITPEIYVVNPDRIIVGKNLHTNQIDTMINRDINKRLGN